MKTLFHAILIGVLAIIGMPPFAGFFSKDEILWKAYIGGGPFLWGLGAITAGCTSFYMVRLLCLTFYGAHRGASHGEHHGESKDILPVYSAPKLCYLKQALFFPR